jgi:hypothetical protein
MKNVKHIFEKTTQFHAPFLTLAILVRHAGCGTFWWGGVDVLATISLLVPPTAPSWH